MLAPIPTRGVATVYSRIGDLFAYLSVAGLVALTGRAFVGRETSRYPRAARPGATSSAH